MTPRPSVPVSFNGSFSEEASTTPTNDVSSKTENSIPKKKVAAHTLAWEVNLLSAAALGAVYAILPPQYRVYIYGFLALIAVDAARYYSHRGKMAGVPYTPPFVSLLTLVACPVRFWAEQGEIACESPDGLSCNTLLGKLMVFVTDLKLCREVMTGEGIYGLYAHPNALWLFGANNLIYMEADPHKKFRAILTPALFSNEALTLYAKAQERVCCDFLAKLAKECQSTGEPFDARIAFRSMAAAASQESFVGPYLTDDLRKTLEEDILLFTLGFLCLPFPYLGTGLARALDAKNRILQAIMGIVPLAREHAAKGEAPRCLLEYWTIEMLAAAKDLGLDDPRDVPGCTNEDVATTVMDFLFAAQDATNSALTFSMDVLAARPDVVSKIRAEVHESGAKQEDLWSLVRDTDKLQYTSRAANQMLHHKPPVPMVPHIALKNTVLGGHAIPKGAVVIPSIAYGAKSGGTSLVFDPDTTDPDPQFVKTPVFGAGQHKCPGRRYAESLLTVFLAVFVAGYDWERVGPRPDTDDIIYYPTLFPADNMFMIKARDI